jgi:hypothetical protein
LRFVGAVGALFTLIAKRMLARLVLLAMLALLALLAMLALLVPFSGTGKLAYYLQDEVEFSFIVGFDIFYGF